jgi:hypothetical protein
MDFFHTIFSQVSKIVKTNMSLCVLMAVMTVGIAGMSLSTQSFAQQADNVTGTFNHTQTNATGDVDWLNTGNWSLTGMTSDSPSFDAVIDMAKPDGSAAHDHQVSEFTLVGSPVSQGNTTILNGTSTITMREGPVTEEPTVITLSDESISVFFEPTKIDDHFGNQSITGTVSS